VAKVIEKTASKEVENETKRKLTVPSSYNNNVGFSVIQHDSSKMMRDMMQNSRIQS
jgi:hypothetical protein